MSENLGESPPPQERPVHPTNVDLSAWTVQKFQEYQQAYKAKTEVDISLDTLANSPHELRNYVNTIAKLLIRREKIISDHLNQLPPERKSMLEQTIIELTQNTLEHSFDSETRKWADCSLDVQSDGEGIVVILKQNTPVPDELISQYNGPEAAVADYYGAGITRISTSEVAAGGAGANLIKGTVEAAQGKLHVEKVGEQTFFRITVPKTPIA